MDISGPGVVLGFVVPSIGPGVRRQNDCETLSILYSGSVRTISILEAEHLCGSRRCASRLS